MRLEWHPHSHHIKASHSIWEANQLIGFYMSACRFEVVWSLL